MTDDDWPSLAAFRPAARTTALSPAPSWLILKSAFCTATCALTRQYSIWCSQGRYASQNHKHDSEIPVQRAKCTRGMWLTDKLESKQKIRSKPVDSNPRLAWLLNSTPAFAKGIGHKFLGNAMRLDTQRKQEHYHYKTLSLHNRKHFFSFSSPYHYKKPLVTQRDWIHRGNKNPWSVWQ